MPYACAMFFNSSFNPTMVRLLPNSRCCSASCRVTFNPTMVRLLPKCQHHELSLLRPFNPTMVRLLLEQVAEWEDDWGELSIPQWCDCCGSGSRHGSWALTFQSHNGAIAAVCVSEEAPVQPKLSIPQWCDCCPRRAEGRINGRWPFNPTMVRLLRDNLCCDTWSLMHFQSHNGAIAALPRHNVALPSILTFNPTMVRLLHGWQRTDDGQQ